MEQIGIEPISLLTQIVNFLLIVLLLSKILYKPVLKVIDERKKKIEEGLKYAEKMQEESEKSEKKRQDLLLKAKNDAKKIIEEGKKNAKKVEEDIIKKAHDEASNIVEKGKKDLVGEKAKMEKQLQKHTIELASLMARKALENSLTKADHEAIINTKIKQIEKTIKKK